MPDQPWVPLLGLPIVCLGLIVGGFTSGLLLRTLPPSPHQPPPVQGMLDPSWERTRRLWRWTLRGHRLSCRRGPGIRRLLACLVLVPGWWVLAPGLLALQYGLTARRVTRYYFAPDDTAVLAITARRRNRWHIGEHLSAAPGTGQKQGKKLRQLLMPDLAAVADRDAITIEATAATPTLAARYADSLTGLEVVGKGLFGSIRMRREPRRIIQLPQDVDATARPASPTTEEGTPDR